MDREKVIKGLEVCVADYLSQDNCKICPYGEGYDTGYCWVEMDADALELLKEQKEEHKRLLRWLSKFCRHIDNGDKWLTDEENLQFFREKMKQQFGWDCD